MNTNPTNNNVVDILKTESALKGIFSAAEIEFLADMMDFHRYKQNDTIVSDGEPAISLMFIISGEVRVLSNDHQRAILGVGEMFGEGMFSEEGIRVADVIASKDTSVVIFTIEHYERLVKKSPSIALKAKNFFESTYHHNKRKNDTFFHTDSTKYLALIAHNEMKSSLADFVKQHIQSITKFPLVATGTTGLLLYKETGVVLSRKVKSGPLGGDQAIGSMISTNNISGIVFFRDPLSAHPHHADIEALGRLCDVYQIPFATNPATAEAVLSHLNNEPTEDKDASNPALEKYQKQQSRVVKQDQPNG